MESSPVVIILIGLPGAGKTTLLQDPLVHHFPDACFDDFHGGSLDGTGNFVKSRHYDALSRELRDRHDCLISDIEYCRSERLAAAEEGLRALSHELGIEIEIRRLYFENNPNACRHNIVHRFGHHEKRDYIEELRKVDALSACYDCPADGTIQIRTCCNKQRPFLDESCA